MSCVSPMSSVSQQNSVADGSTVVVEPLSTLLPLLGRFTSGEAASILKSYYDACHRSAQLSSCLASLGVSSVTDSSVSGASGSSCKSKPNKRIRRRAKAAVSSVSLVSSSDDVLVSPDHAGFCYLPMFPRDSWQAVAKKYQSYPTVAALLGASLEELLPVDQLELLMVQQVGNVLHIGATGFPLLRFMSRALLSGVRVRPCTLTVVCASLSPLSPISPDIVFGAPFDVGLRPYSYLELFEPFVWMDVVQRLGDSPVPVDLLSCPSDWYVSWTQVMELRVSEQSGIIAIARSGGAVLVEYFKQFSCYGLLVRLYPELGDVNRDSVPVSPADSRQFSGMSYFLSQSMDYRSLVLSQYLSTVLDCPDHGSIRRSLMKLSYAPTSSGYALVGDASLSVEIATALLQAGLSASLLETTLRTAKTSVMQKFLSSSFASTWSSLMHVSADDGVLSVLSVLGLFRARNLENYDALLSFFDLSFDTIVSDTFSGLFD